MKNGVTLLTRIGASACAFFGAAALWGTPVTDDCIAGKGCIATPSGKGEFEFFANFDIESGRSTGWVRYSDPKHTVASDQLYDYADPEGPGGYRILSFRVSDPASPGVSEIRIVVDDFGAATDDYFEIRLLGEVDYAVGGKLLAECGGGIAISQDCGATNPPSNPVECDDFVTGGGWIVGPTGAKANFGVHGGIRNGHFWGGLNFLDHKTRMHVKSTAATDYTHVSSVGRQIKFNVNIDGRPGTAVVTVYDNGEPGRNDVFQIQLSTGYQAVGDLGGARPGGGNLQLHKAKCDKSGKPDKPNHGGRPAKPGRPEQSGKSEGKSSQDPRRR